MCKPHLLYMDEYKHRFLFQPPNIRGNSNDLGMTLCFTGLFKDAMKISACNSPGFWFVTLECLWTVGGCLRCQREPTLTQTEHANATH